MTSWCFVSSSFSPYLHPRSLLHSTPPPPPTAHPHPPSPSPSAPPPTPHPYSTPTLLIHDKNNQLIDECWERSVWYTSPPSRATARTSRVWRGSSRRWWRVTSTCTPREYLRSGTRSSRATIRTSWTPSGTLCSRLSRSLRWVVFCGSCYFFLLPLCYSRPFPSSFLPLLLFLFLTLSLFLFHLFPIQRRDSVGLC